MTELENLIYSLLCDSFGEDANISSNRLEELAKILAEISFEYYREDLGR